MCIGVHVRVNAFYCTSAVHALVKAARSGGPMGGQLFRHLRPTIVYIMYNRL